MIFDTMIINAAGISVLICFVRKKYLQPLTALGIHSKKLLANVFFAVVGYITFLPIVIVIILVTFLVAKWFKYSPPVQPIVQLFIEEKQTGLLWFSALFAALFGPVAEEIFFRGFMYGALKRISGATGAIIVTSVIFAALHAHLAGFFPIFALGLLLAYMYEKTGSLVTPVTIHVVHNLAMVCFVFVVRKVGLF